jgi:hypothetical protein
MMYRSCPPTVDELISPLFKEVLGQELLSALEEAVVGFVVGETSRILLTLTQVRGDLQIWCCKAHLYVKRCDSRRLFSSRETVMGLVATLHKCFIYVPPYHFSCQSGPLYVT